MYTGVQVAEMDISICAHFLYSEIDQKLIVNLGRNHNVERCLRMSHNAIHSLVVRHIFLSRKLNTLPLNN